MPDPTPAEQIRADAVERIARAFYDAEAADELATTGTVLPPWERLVKSDAHRCLQDAQLAVDALGDRLPTRVEEQLVGGFEPFIHTREDIENQAYPPVRTVRRYVTDWHEVPDA